MTDRNQPAHIPKYRRHKPTGQVGLAPLLAAGDGPVFSPVRRSWGGRG